MRTEFEVVDNYGKLPDLDRYTIEDTPENEKEWRFLQERFSREFREYTNKQNKDYEYADWHYGMRAIYVYIYNANMYSESFVTKVKKVINIRKPCFAQFECYGFDGNYMGIFMVTQDKVSFDDSCKESGLINILFP